MSRIAPVEERAEPNPAVAVPTAPMGANTATAHPAAGAAALPTSSSMKRIVDCDGRSSYAASSTSDDDFLKCKSPVFPSTRFFMALLLCCCFIALAISTSNISVALVCMAERDQPTENNATEKLMAQFRQRLRRNPRSAASATAELQRVADGTANDSATTNMTKCAMARFKKNVMELSKSLGEQYDEEQLRLSTITTEKCHAEHFDWSKTQQGILLGAQNAGSLLMLFTGTRADQLNSKWTIVVSMALLILSNVAVPLVSRTSVWLTIAARVLTGFADALLQPATSTMITRWFPPKERPFAIGLVTGGRQIGTLSIMPLAGWLCEHRELLGGWPATFYFSALSCSCVMVAWILLSADKPAKHSCIARKEQHYIEAKIREENLGKRKQRKQIPWGQIARCPPVYAGVAALVCHEYPLVIMLQLLPQYFNQVLGMSMTENGFVSALPILVLFISKTLSSSLSSMISSRKKGRFVIARTTLVKIFNAIASLGLGVCTAAVPLFHTPEHLVYAVIALCMSAAFAGLHTPGVQTALLQLAPAYTGIVTGIAFGVVAVFGIINKITSMYITTNGTLAEWRIVFVTSSVIAVLPVFFFTIWGSADRQHWATIHSGSTSTESTLAPSTVDGDEKGSQLPNGPHHFSKPVSEDGKSIDGEAKAARNDGEEEEADEDDEEHVASALRMRMFLGDESDEGRSSRSTSPTDVESAHSERF